MKFLLLILLLAVGFSFSCKKKTVVSPPQPCENDTICTNNNSDTFQPSEYIMAYPGSWWEYDDGSIDSCLGWFPVALISSTPKGNCKTVTLETIMLPFHEGLGFIKNESQVTYSTFLEKTIFQPYIGGNPGDIIYSGIGEMTHVADYDSLLIQGQYYLNVQKYKHAIPISYTIGPGGPPPGPIPTNNYEYYFSKNVGLIKYHHNYAGVGTLFEKELINHYIAPH